MARSFGLLVLFSIGSACARSERMETIYAQRCLGCHGPAGAGDGPSAASLPVPVPHFRETVKNSSVTRIRSVIAQGKGLMPAFEPALRKSEIQDMVLMVRVVSRKGRSLEWWERFDPLVWAHCNVPWEFVLGYDQPPEKEQP